MVPSALSALEQAQITGSGTTVGQILIDPVVTVITLESPLTDITAGAPMSGRLLISGGTHASMTMIQGGPHGTVFSIRSRYVRIEGFHILGGQIGIDAQMGASGVPFPEMAHVHGCMLENQVLSGIRLHGAGTDESMLMVAHTDLRSMPVGITVDDQTTGGMVMGECEFIMMDGAVLGADVFEGGTGPMSMLFFFRSTFVNGDTLARGRRGPASTRQFMFRFVFTDADCALDVTDIQGTTNGATMVHHHHGDFRAAAGHKAFYVWPRTAEFDIHGSEMVFDGDVAITGNRFTMRVWQQNNLYRNGTLVYDVDGALPNLLWNRYENCVLDVPSTARSPVTVRASEFSSTSISGNSLLAPVQLQGCWRSGGTVSGSVTETQPAPARFLGATNVSPVDPQIGTSITLTTDLPLGVGLLWDVMVSVPRPVTTAEPVRLYGDPATMILIHGWYALHSQLVLPIPTDVNLVGVEFYLQGVSLRMFGQSYIPAFHLPRGERVTPRI